MKKKSLFLLVVAALILALVPVSAASDEAVPLTGEVINVYNWGMYISDGSDGGIDVNAEFTRRTGIQVNYSTYDTNEALYSKLKTGGASYDVVIPSDYMVAKLIEEGLVQTINYDNVPNYQYVDEEFKNLSYDPENKYSVPYTWGCVGIIYNKKYVTKPVDSWSIMWDEEYSGKILMFDNPRDAFGISELLLGYSINTTKNEEIEAAAAKLSEQKHLVQSYVMDQVFDPMEDEEAWIAPYYAGDYLMMAKENENLEFCFPKEGFNLFVDALCIPTSAQNKDGAEAYINFLCDPEISGKNLDYLGYSTPISEAKQYMSEEVAQSEIAYPSEEVLARGQTFENLPSDTVQQMNDLFNDVKASGSGWSYIVFIGIGVVLIGLVVFLVIRKKRRNDY
jgi:spermidine/putrescine transport system substrate-binding protein